MQAIIYTFNFEHHGKYSSFHRLSAYLQDQQVIDATLRLPRNTPIPLKRRITLYWHKYGELRLWRYYRCKTPHVFHYLRPENNFRFGRIWKNNHKLILSCHQPIQKLHEMESQGDRYRDFFRGLATADVIVVLSATQISGYRSYAPQADVIYIPLGVDTHYFQPNTTLVRRPCVVTVGSWLRDYNCWAQVVRQVHATRPDIEFIVVANPTEIKGAQEALSDEGARVRFLSGISDDELLQIYQQAGVLFLPLHDAVANNALLEGMATGLPTVITDLPATREYLGDSTGLLVANNCISTYSQAILDFLSDQTKWQAVSQQERERAVEQFSWERVAEQYKQLYHSLL